MDNDHDKCRNVYDIILSKKECEVAVILSISTGKYVYICVFKEIQNWNRNISVPVSDFLYTDEMNRGDKGQIFKRKGAVRIAVHHVHMKKFSWEKLIWRI